ncbi:MAG: hypothetical protein RB292_04750 [Patescibacteria group bacterium]|jgi:hypothetical protein|nr:hypothetical protein [Patescibacteria group bacterium]
MSDRENFNPPESAGQSILEKIKQRHIIPKPKWEFLLKDYVTWVIFALAIIIGSLATAVIIFVANYTNWRYYEPELGTLKGLLISLPYFWLAIMVIFLVIAFYNLKHTKKGYKFNIFLIALSSIIISISLGGLIYAAGFGEKLEDIFYRRIPFYQQFLHQRGRLLINPEQGRLAGVVIEVQPEYITVRDFHGQLWKIATTTQNFYIGNRVLLRGKKISEAEFTETDIRFWISHPRLKPPPPPRF